MPRSSLVHMQQQSAHGHDLIYNKDPGGWGAAKTIRDQGEEGTAEKSVSGEDRGATTSGGATTRRSFSEIRQKYCKIKEKEKQQEHNEKVVEEWVQQDEQRTTKGKPSKGGGAGQDSQRWSHQVSSAHGAAGAAPGQKLQGRSKAATIDQARSRKPGIAQNIQKDHYGTRSGDLHDDEDMNQEFTRRRSSHHREDSRQSRQQSVNSVQMASQKADQLNALQYISQIDSEFVSPMLQRQGQETQHAQFGLSGASSNQSRPLAQKQRSLPLAPTRQKPAAQEAQQPVEGYTEYFSHGLDSLGQLGHAQNKHDPNRKLKTLVPKSLSFDILISRVACGAAHTLILSQRGELFSMGSNHQGQLGLNDRQLDFTTAPQLVPSVKKMSLQITQVAAGRNHNLLLTQDGQIYSWGCNAYGQCGQLIRQHQKMHMPFKLFSPAIGSGRNDIYQIECGDNFSGFLDSEGKVHTFGDNSEGQLGIGPGSDSFGSGSVVEQPTQMHSDVRFKQISFGHRHVLLLSVNSEVYGCGLNSNFELGQGHLQQLNLSNFANPVIIPSLQDSQVKKVVAGAFSAAIDQACQIFIWGKGEFGLIKSPQKLYMDKVLFEDCLISKFPTSANSLSVNSFAIARDTKGKVYSWGSNDHGQLGHGDERDRKLPSQILQLKRKEISQISIGGDFAIMLGKDIKLNQLSREDENLPTLSKEEHFRKPFDSKILQQFQCQKQLLFENEEKTIKIHDQNQSMVTSLNGYSHDQSMNQGGDEQTLDHSHLHDQTMVSAANVDNSQNMNPNISLLDNSLVHADFQTMTVPSRQSPTQGQQQHYARHMSSVDNRSDYEAQDAREDPPEVHSPTAYTRISSIVHDQRRYAHSNEAESLLASNLPLGRQAPYAAEEPLSVDISNQRSVGQGRRGEDANQNTTPLQRHGGLPKPRARSGAGRAGLYPHSYNMIDRQDDDSNDYYIYKLQSQNLQIELDQARAEAAGAKKESGQLRRQLSRVKEAEDQIKQDIQLVIEDRESIERRMSEKLMELRKSELKNQKLEEELSELGQQFEDDQKLIKTQVGDLNAQVSQNLIDRTKMTREHEETLRTQEDQLTTQAAALKQQLSHYQSTLCEQTQLLEQCQGVQTHNAQLQAQVMKLIAMDEENKKQAEKFEESENQITALQAQKLALNSELQIAASQVTSLEAQISDLHEKMEQLKDENSKSTSQVKQSMQKQVKDLNSLIMNLQVQIKQKEADSQDQEAKIDGLLREIQYSKSVYDKNTASIQSGSEKEIAQLQAVNARLEKDLDDLEFKNQQLHAAVGEKAEQIQDYLRGVESQCLQQSEILQENERLDEMICELQERNQELSEMLGQTMYAQAEEFKHKVLGTLIKDRENGQMDSRDDQQQRPIGNVSEGFGSRAERSNTVQQPSTTHAQQYMSRGSSAMATLQHQNLSLRSHNGHKKHNKRAKADHDGTFQQQPELAFRSIENQSNENRFQSYQGHRGHSHTLSVAEEPGIRQELRVHSIDRQLPKTKVRSQDLAYIIDDMPATCQQRQETREVRKQGTHAEANLAVPTVRTAGQPAKLTVEEVRQLENRRRLEQIMHQEGYDPRLSNQYGDEPTLRKDQGQGIYNSSSTFQHDEAHFNPPPPVSSSLRVARDHNRWPQQPGDPNEPSSMNNQLNTTTQQPIRSPEEAGSRLRKCQMLYGNYGGGGNTRHHRHVLDESFRKIQEILLRTNGLESSVDDQTCSFLEQRGQSQAHRTVPGQQLHLGFQGELYAHDMSQAESMTASMHGDGVAYSVQNN